MNSFYYRKKKIIEVQKKEEHRYRGYRHTCGHELFGAMKRPENEENKLII